MLALEQKLTTEAHGENNILFSLEYLKEEARREKNFVLYEIIQAACVLARISSKDIQEESFKYPDGDLLHGAKFLLKFLGATKGVQENVVEYLSKQVELQDAADL